MSITAWGFLVLVILVILSIRFFFFPKGFFPKDGHFLVKIPDGCVRVEAPPFEPRDRVLFWELNGTMKLVQGIVDEVHETQKRLTIKFPKNPKNPGDGSASKTLKERLIDKENVFRPID